MPREDEVGWMFVGQPQLAEQAQRTLDLKGDLPLRLVDPHLALSVTADDWTRPEFDWARRTMRGLVGGSVGPVAAQFAGVGVGYANATPRDQAMLCIVDTVIINNFTAALLQYTISQVTQSVLAYATGQGVATDTRFQKLALASTRAAIVAGTNAAPRQAGNGVTVQVPANSTLILPFSAVLCSVEASVATQGGVLLVEGTVVNSVVGASFLYRERPALSSELP